MSLHRGSLATGATSTAVCTRQVSEEKVALAATTVCKMVCFWSVTLAPTGQQGGRAC